VAPGVLQFIDVVEKGATFLTHLVYPTLVERRRGRSLGKWPSPAHWWAS